jgi:hypothetical protein
LFIGAGQRDAPQKLAGIRFARGDDRGVFTRSKSQGFAIKTQIGLLHFGTVALKTGTLQHRQYLLGKIHRCSKRQSQAGQTDQSNKGTP